jgi:hypothetical protein
VLKKRQIETAESAAYSIPQAGAMVGLSRSGAYDAARRGEMPILEFGRKKIVPKAVWDRMLGIAGAVPALTDHQNKRAGRKSEATPVAATP